MTKKDKKESSCKQQEKEDKSTAGKKRDWNDIEQLFEQKKAKQKAESKQKKNEMEMRAHEKHRTSVAEQTTRSKSSEWVDDGLGGIYNSEGFTGRVEDGVKIFKAHILNKPDAGRTDLCPFDCDCCFI